jgi:chromosome segregation protein
VRRLESVAERLRSLDTLVEQRIALLAVVPQTLDIDVAGRSAQADAAEREAAALEARCAEQEGTLDRARAETQAAFEAVQAVDVQAAEQRQRAQARERRHTALAGAVEVAEGRVATAERQVQTQREAVAAAADRQRQAVAALPETEQATADPGRCRHRARPGGARGGRLAHRRSRPGASRGQRRAGAGGARGGRPA